MDFINKYFKKIKQFIVKYIYTNRLFLSYFILALCGTIIIREVTVGGPFNYKPLLCDIGFILLIGSFGYLFKPKNQFKYFFTCLILFTIIEVVNSIFYIFYEDFASLAQLGTLNQVETVADSIFVKIRLVDFIYILQPIIFYYIHNRLKISPYYNFIGKIEKKKDMALGTLLVGLGFLIITFATASGADYSRLAKQWNRRLNVERFGIIMYELNDAFQATFTKVNTLFGRDDALTLFQEFFNDEERNTYRTKNKYTGILEGYNIIYVHMESMQDFLMDLEFNGEEVVPNLKKLAKEGMFFSNFYPQIALGTSSDAEYIMLTGLLPSNGNTVFSGYANNTFITLPKILKEDRGYYTFSMHGNQAVMWNRKSIHPHLGYTDMYFKESFTFEDVKGSDDYVGLGINDKLFFSQAIPILENIEKNNKNYFGTIITLSNHSPFEHHQLFTYDINDYYTNDVTGDTLSTCYLCERDIGKYIVSSHYADEALGDFISYIKNSEYFNNTIFVFYGDHDAKMSYKEMNYLYNYDYLTGELKDPSDPTYIPYDSFDHYLNKKTPLIIWTKNEKLAQVFSGQIDYVTGMYDVAPTLYNMLNIDNKYVLGNDIFNIKDNNVVVFPSGNYLTNKVYYNISTGEYKEIKNNIILDDEYIAKNLEYSDKLIEIGNAIIRYDLFNDKKESE